MIFLTYGCLVVVVDCWPFTREISDNRRRKCFADTRLLSLMQLRRTYEDRIYLQGFELPNRHLREIVVLTRKLAIL